MAFETAERKPIKVIDTTLRDGLQNPETPEHGKYFVPIDERQEIVGALIQYGVPYIEVFSPRVSDMERDSLQQSLYTRNELAPKYGRTSILAHVRCEDADVAAAIEGGVDGLNMYMGTSAESQRSNHGKNLGEVANRARDLLEQIRRGYPHLQLRFSGEDAFRTPMDDLYKVYDGISNSVDRFGMPDTVGIAHPLEVEIRVRALKERYPHVGLEGHFHNDRGFSLINALTAVLAGMEFMDTSVLGLAERSGITSLTGIIFNLYQEHPELTAGYNLEASYALNVLVAEIMNMQVPFTEPVSLTNRTHVAGVHTGAMLKGGDSSTVYEANALETFGVTQRRLLLGPLSGWHVVSYYLKNILHFEGVTDITVKKITDAFKKTFSNESPYQDPKQVLNKLAHLFQLRQSVEPELGIKHVEHLEDKES